MRTRSRGRLAVGWLSAATVVGVCGPSLLLGGAVAEPQTRSGWWSAAPAEAVEGVVQVASGADGPTAFAALTVTSAGLRDGRVLDLPVVAGSLTGTPLVVACAAADPGWTPGAAQAWEHRPAFDCASPVTGELAADGSQLSFALGGEAPLPESVDVVLVPEPGTEQEFVIALSTPQSLVAVAPSESVTPSESETPSESVAPPTEEPASVPEPVAEPVAEAPPVEEPAPPVDVPVEEPAPLHEVEPAPAAPPVAEVVVEPSPEAPRFTHRVEIGFASEPLLSRHVAVPVPPSPEPVPAPLVAGLPPAEAEAEPEAPITEPQLVTRAFHQVPPTDDVPHSVPYDVVDDPWANLLFPPLVAAVLISGVGALRRLRRPRYVQPAFVTLRFEQMLTELRMAQAA